jgi:hypothetical protein
MFGNKLVSAKRIKISVSITDEKGEEMNVSPDFIDGKIVFNVRALDKIETMTIVNCRAEVEADDVKLLQVAQTKAQFKIKTLHCKQTLRSLMDKANPVPSNPFDSPPSKPFNK